MKEVVLPIVVKDYLYVINRTSKSFTKFLKNFFFVSALKSILNVTLLDFEYVRYSEEEYVQL